DFANAQFPREDGRAWGAADTLKHVVLALVSPTGDRELVMVGLPGDREVDLKRAEAAFAPNDVEAATDADFAAHPGLVKGYIGPGNSAGIRYLLDPQGVDGTPWTTGANEPGRHVFHLVAGRDFTAGGSVEIGDVRDGDLAADGTP